MSAKERRKKRRLVLQKSIRHSIYQVLGTPVFQETTTLDLSTSGLSFETNHSYTKGNLVLLELELNDVLTRLLVCVAWVKKGVGDAGRDQVGAELIAIDPTHKEVLQDTVSKMIKRQSNHRPVRKKLNKNKRKKIKAKTKVKTKTKARAKTKTKKTKLRKK